ncbi:unnamed protein product [Urochloa humidicola]
MDISNIFRPAINGITSSIASTASYGFTRMLSFTGSFNDRTSLLQPHDAEAELAAGPEHEDEPTPPAQQAREPPAAGSATALDTFDIEAAAPLAPPTTTGEGRGHQEPTIAARDDNAESKRVAKSVHTVCLFAASASLVLFVNLPTRDDGVASKPGTGTGAGAGGLYIADLAFISLGFFSSLGLYMFSIVVRPGGEAARRRRRCRSGGWWSPWRPCSWRSRCVWP